MPQVKVPDYSASERQAKFHTSTADETLYGGAAGGGKTAAIVAEGVTIALEHPGIPVDFFRRTIPELKGTILPEIYKQCGTYINAGFMTWHGQDRKFTLDNGSTLNLNYCDTDNDIYRYQGREMPVLLFDELTQFPQAWVEYLKTRNRTSNPDWPVVFKGGTNPGGIGHGYIKRYFVDIAPAETVYTDPQTKLTRIFIPAKVDDHPIEKFKQDYSKKLDAITDPMLRRALRNGEWDVFEGQVFTEFNRDKHVVDPFSIPDHWRRWRSMDYGNKNSTLWFAQDPATERVFVYREWRTEAYMTVDEKARTTKELEAGEPVTYGLADPALWNGSGDHNNKEGKSVAQMYLDAGVSWQPANNDRKAGLAVVHDMLSIADDGLPKLQFFSTCISIIRTLPALPYDKHKVDDVDTKADDHDYDALRYGLMKFRDKPQEEVPNFAVPSNFMVG
jgi:phage terminase large subunit